jgi:hypothetical protein
MPGWVPGQQISGFSTVIGNYTPSLIDRYLRVDASGGPLTVTLPSAAGSLGAAYTFARVDSAPGNLVTIATTSGQTIDGSSSQVLVFKGHSMMVVSDGSNWLIVESNYRGTELGYAESVTNASTTNTATGNSALAANVVPGLSVTVVGAGRPVLAEFMGSGVNVANAGVNFGAALLVNGANQKWEFNTNPPITSSGDSVPLPVRRRLVLTAGTSYTFQVGMWTASGTVFFIANATQPMFLAVVGQ